jgi:hypothetical protein
VVDVLKSQQQEKEEEGENKLRIGICNTITKIID